MQLIPKKSVQL